MNAKGDYRPVDYRDLTFAEVLEVNRVRCRRWHDEDSEPWSLADWSNAMCGEAGELANVVKKLRRHESGTASPMDPDEDVLRAQAADEIADVFLYLGLLADAIGVDMPSAIARKFDAVSIRQDFPDRIVARRVPELVGIVQTARRTLSLSDYHDGGRAALRAVYDLLGSACLPDGPAAYSAPDQEVQP